MRISIYTILLLIISSPLSVWSQGNAKKYADNLFERGLYHEAREVFYSFNEDNKEYYLKRGICNYYTSNLDEALSDLGKSYEKGMDSGEILKYFALTHHKRKEFFEAARAYKLYLNEIDRDDPERRDIIHAIKNCDYGRKAQFMEQIGFVENLGSGVNSPYDEISPVRSPNYDNKYYFSSNRKGSVGGLRNDEGLKDDIYGKYGFDIYTFEKKNDVWGEISGVPPLLNSARDEIIQGFSEEGKVLIFLRSGAQRKTELVTDTFSLDITSESRVMKTSANLDLGDKDLFFLNDSILLFSSKREGGFGGYDIYISMKYDGNWSTPENLGPEINSPFDELSPFLTRSGTMLYFSSNRTEAIGGYDIFVANYGVERGKWSPASNLGMPISSPGDDLYFSLSPDGRSAVLASDREESTGGFDLFVAYLKDQVYEQLGSITYLPFMDKRQEGSVPVTSGNKSNKETDENTEKSALQVKTREMVITPLNYGVTDVFSDVNNSKVLRDLLDMMIIYPGMKVVFTGHTQGGGSKAYDLYFSVKRAEQSIKYLLDNGVDRKRLSVYGAGSAYPMVNNRGLALATKNNNRIEIKLVEPEKEGLLATYAYPAISDFYRDDRADIFRTRMDNLNFRVVVARTRQMYDNPFILRLDDVVIEKDLESDSYQYSAGIFPSYSEAVTLRESLISEGFPETAIKIFRKGIELTKEQIEELAPQFPEAKAFLDNEFR